VTTQAPLTIFNPFYAGPRDAIIAAYGPLAQLAEQETLNL
jgi:hypothetical protein